MLDNIWLKQVFQSYGNLPKLDPIFFEIMQNRKIYIFAAFYRQFCLYIMSIYYETRYFSNLFVQVNRLQVNNTNLLFNLLGISQYIDKI